MAQRSGETDSPARTGEIWVLGATGRTGRAVAARLVADGVAPVLVGRDAGRLRRAAEQLGPGSGVRTVVAATPEATADEVARQRPAVVVNTIGDYARTALPVVRACLPGGHYVDLASDLGAMEQLAALHDEAESAGSTLVTGAGFGVLGTEAVVARLCAGRPVPARVRVDALASVAVEAGRLGEALAASMVDVAATGGRRYAGGRLVRTRLGADVYRFTLPDGVAVTSVGAPSGELYGARTASGAPDVVATSMLVPAAPAVRALLPVAGALLRVPALRRLVVSRLARVELPASPRPREHTWGHAVVTWADGTEREGWLRAGEAMDFTAAAAATVAQRLARGEGKPGAWTPATVLGPDLAVEAGGTFVDG
ncbi:saccharopine dehydrogenase NADP-binding domain-containing protein [Promicromonospora sp. MS192]|uniref:saccharopine dehydrogenase NADP-binding domain-containing protein n=1 Tax=Promicromonospora sp. MS192 TaxID=3412684 RepID=UPI003C2F7141